MYTSSKAALTQASEAWRLELAPLGVRVITLMTGGVATNFTGNIPALELPKSSYYLGVKDVIREQQSQKPEEIPMGVKPEAFAQDVLRLVEREATGTDNGVPGLGCILTPHAGKVWIGGGAGLVKWTLWLSPQSVIVSCRTPGSGCANCRTQDRMCLRYKPFTEKLLEQRRKAT
jgi:1-acylglycerone phosphate reductase